MRNLCFDDESALRPDLFVYAGEFFCRTCIIMPSDDASIVITSKGLGEKL